MAKRRKPKGLFFQNPPPRGTGLMRGTARKRGRGSPLSNIERAKRHKKLYGQFNGPILKSVMNRVKTIRNRIF